MKWKGILWEVTGGCNLRCAHCGSSCTEAGDNELTPAEALALCDALIQLKPDYVSFTGGEPLLRSDIFDIVEKLSNGGIPVRLLTNGTLVRPEDAQRFIDSGLELLSISIDGLREHHDKIRGAGMYDKIWQCYDYFHNSVVYLAANTTVMKTNISELPQLSEQLISYGVKTWQVQPAIPMGNMAKIREKTLDPEDYKILVDFAYSQNIDGKISVFLPDTVGYYTYKEAVSRQLALGTKTPPVWNGCNAGRNYFGILSDGSVTGCVSIRDRNFIEGNIREKNLSDIVSSEDAFSWRKTLCKEKLSGFCAQCKYADICMGGCSNLRLVFSGSIYGENTYCLWRNENI
jgi:radical SAM protein with 4Fe4S-binding SPASM domain